MTDTWINLPLAVDRLAKAQGVDEIAARSALLDFIRVDGISTRVKLRQGFSSGLAPELDAPLYSSCWSDLSDLNGKWWKTGIADFGRGYSYRGIQVREEDLSAQLGDFGSSGATTIAAMQNQPPAGRKRGRKNKYDWEAAFAHIIAIADSHDGLHPDGPGKADVPFLSNILADWFSARHPEGDHPADSILREKASIIHDALISRTT